MDFRFVDATRAEQQWALELVLRQVAESDTESAVQAQELLASARTGQVSLKGLFIGTSDAECIGAGLAILQSDGTAHVWPPAVVNSETRTAAENLAIQKSLATFCLTWLTRSGARLAQCMTPIDRVDLHFILQSVGFEPLTQLDCMRHELIDIPNIPLSDDCECTEYSDEIAGRFETVMQQTHAESQDCQGLQGRRTAAETLAAHRLAGAFDPALWQLCQVLGEDMGIMLCADHREQHIWELLYLGIIPKFRNQGFGLALVSDMLWQAQISGAESVVVAVDASNVAAKSLYESCGFQSQFLKQIHIWTNTIATSLDSTACAQAKSLDGTF